MESLVKLNHIKALSHNLRPSPGNPPDCDSSICALIHKCWNRDPKQRPLSLDIADELSEYINSN